MEVLGYGCTPSVGVMLSLFVNRAIHDFGLFERPHNEPRSAKRDGPFFSLRPTREKQALSTRVPSLSTRPPELALHLF